MYLRVQLIHSSITHVITLSNWVKIEYRVLEIVVSLAKKSYNCPSTENGSTKVPPVFNFRTAEANPLITSLSLTTNVLCQDSKQFYAATSLTLIAFVTLFMCSQRDEIETTHQ